MSVLPALALALEMALLPSALMFNIRSSGAGLRLQPSARARGASPPPPPGPPLFLFLSSSARSWEGLFHHMH